MEVLITGSTKYATQYNKPQRRLAEMYTFRAVQKTRHTTVASLMFWTKQKKNDFVSDNFVAIKSRPIPRVKMSEEREMGTGINLNVHGFSVDDTNILLL